MPEPHETSAAEARTARSRFRESLREGRAQLATMAARPLLTEQEKRELTEIAARGDMGREMQEFARDVDRGTADWESFVRRTDGRSALFQDLVHRSEERFSDEVEAALVESEPPPGIDDPRPHPWPPHDPGTPRR